MALVSDRPIPGFPYQLLDPAEEIRGQAEADEGAVLVTDRRLAVSLETGRLDLDVPFDALRRIQFDLERIRPATLVIVPEHPKDPPIVLVVRPSQYGAMAQAIAEIGTALHGIERDQRARISVDEAAD